MRILLIVTLVLIYAISHAQENEKITNIDFVQIIDDNKEETIYYYQNNWLVLRNMAVERNYIDSFHLLEVEPSEEAPYHILLITTFLNDEQYQLREEHFEELIEERGPLRLMNEKEPAAFRKILYNKSQVRHLN